MPSLTVFTDILYDSRNSTNAEFTMGDLQTMVKAENKLKGSWRNIVNLPISTANIQAGHDWYVEANVVAKTVGVLAGYANDEAIKVGAGILSAQSPMRDWDLNIAISLLLVTKGTRKHFVVQHNKALAIMQGRDPMKVLGARATKTKAFYQAIIEPNNDTTKSVIDRHAVAVYMGRSVSDRELKALDSNKVYDRIANAYLRASKETGLNHHILQAMTWTQWRQDKGYSQSSSRQLATE